jgi:hypothetical protein
VSNRRKLIEPTRYGYKPQRVFTRLGRLRDPVDQADVESQRRAHRTFSRDKHRRRTVVGSRPQG